LLFVTSVCVHVTAAAAHAHPKIDEAQRRIEAAEFDGALRLLAEAETGTELTREEALRLLELRALVHLALNEDDEAVEALRVLAVLSPEHTFGPQTSPDLVAAFERARASAPPPPVLSVQHEFLPDGVRVSAAVQDDVLGVARSVRLWTRAGDQPWRSTLATDTIVYAASKQRVEFRADALGIGGAPVLLREAESVLMPERDEQRAAAARPGASPWLYAGVIGGALAIAGTVTAILLLGEGGDDTRLLPPRVVEP
jgi:hypothetical protein